MHKQAESIQAAEHSNE